MQSITLETRLQNLITGWNGAQRDELLMGLHNQCVDIAGRENALLPARFFSIPDLDTTTLRKAVKTEVHFQIDPGGRFDSVLVPTGKADGPLDRFLLAIEANLPIQDQVALYAHATGHLLLNYQARDLESGLDLDPNTGMAHYDRLADLRFIERAANPIDRQVLAGVPELSKLLELPEESPAAQATATRDLQQRLIQLGWTRTRRYLEAPYEYTAGRVLTSNTRRGKKLSIDILLRASVSLPIGVVHAQRTTETEEYALRRVQDAAARLHVPFAYLVTTSGTILECAYLEEQTEPTTLLELPTHDELVNRWFSFLQLTDRQRQAIIQPYGRGKIPRYYQDTAINQALIAIFQAQSGLRQRRVLLTLATGTGKTQVAFQVIWKLKQSGLANRVMFLADRNYLLSQAATNDFAALAGVWMAEGEPNTARDMVFASYQWLTYKTRSGLYNYQLFEPRFFNLIIIDECHRGSASADSEWRKVLDYFSGAIQVGLTATPLKTKEVESREYFGNEVYSYSLSRGINDGFLAPYRVHRVFIQPSTQEAAEETADTSSSTSDQVHVQSVLDLRPDDEANAEPLSKEAEETNEALRKYTHTIAEHLARYLQQGDPHAKTIIFCIDSQHAAEMRDELRKLCAAWTRAGDIVRIVNKDGLVGEADLYKFCATDKSQPFIVTTARLLSTGIDAPMCKNIVLARSVGSMVEFKQIIGRGTRLFADDTHVKNSFTILDYAGAIKHFFDRDFDGNPESIFREPLLPQAVATNPDQAEPAAANSTETPAATEQDDTESQSPPAIASQAEPPSTEQPAPVPAPMLRKSESSEQIDFEITSNGPSAETITEADEAEAEPVNPSVYPAEHSGNVPLEQQTTLQEQNTVLAYQQAAETEVATQNEQISTQSASAFAEPAEIQDRGQSVPPSPPPLPTHPVESRQIKKRKDGTLYAVSGEWIFELGADNIPIRVENGPACARKALLDVLQSPEELRIRWTESLQRQDILATLDERAVPWETLATILGLPEADPFDILLQTVFAEPALARDERVARLRWQQPDFFQAFARNPLASQVLDAILDWYVHIPIQNLSAPHKLTVSNPELLGLPAIKRLGTLMDLAQAFQQCGMHPETALEELQRLLYSV